jgi:hypothetical protein
LRGIPKCFPADAIGTDSADSGNRYTVGHVLLSFRAGRQMRKARLVEARRLRVVGQFELVAAETGGVGLWPAGTTSGRPAVRQKNRTLTRGQRCGRGRPRHLDSASAKLTHYSPETFRRDHRAAMLA